MDRYGSTLLALWAVLVIVSLTTAYAHDLWLRRHGREGLTTEQWLWFGGVLVIGFAIGTLIGGSGRSNRPVAVAPLLVFAAYNFAQWSRAPLKQRDRWRLVSAGVWLLLATANLVL